MLKYTLVKGRFVDIAGDPIKKAPQYEGQRGVYNIDLKQPALPQPLLTPLARQRPAE